MKLLVGIACGTLVLMLCSAVAWASLSVMFGEGMGEIEWEADDDD